MLETILKLLPYLTLVVGLYSTYRYFILRRIYLDSLKSEINEKHINRDWDSRDREIFYKYERLEIPKPYYSSYFYNKANRYKLLAFSSFLTTIIFFLLLTSFDVKNEIRQNIVDGLVKGKMAYKIPDSMKIDENYPAVVTISKSLNDSILLSSLDTTNFVKQEIRIASRVKVLLLDETTDNFKIVPLNSDEQLVDDSTNTIWKWNVVPTEPGKNKLVVRVSVKVLDKLGENYKDIPVFERTIVVTSTLQKTVWHFLKEYWIYLTFGLTIILIPLIRWLSKKYSSWKEAKNNKRNPIGFKKSGT